MSALAPGGILGIIIGGIFYNLWKEDVARVFKLVGKCDKCHHAISHHSKENKKGIILARCQTCRCRHFVFDMAAIRRRDRKYARSLRRQMEKQGYKYIVNRK